MEIKHICFIAGNYPTNEDPVYTFVRQLVCSVADLGIKCSVIAPQSITKNIIYRKLKRPYHWIDKSKKNFTIDIYQPSYISFSNFKIFDASLSNYFWCRAVINSFEKINLKPTLLYGHFWQSGIAAAMIGEKYNLPVFVASGESEIWVRDLYSPNVLSRYLEKVNGVICVSSKTMKENIDLNLTTKEKMVVIPNAIDRNVFYFEDKIKARKRLGFGEGVFIVAFTGAFINRKGVLRLSEAISKAANVKSIFIGSGEQKPNVEGILFCGKLPHHKVVHYLNAADVFVLPTLAEGCCNAIIEAMACGLPVISSDLSFNDEILSEQNSIRVNSNDINEIANAIRFLRDNPQEREKMSKASLEKANELDIENRAKKIIHFIGKQISQKNA